MTLDFKTLYHHAPCGFLFTKEDGTLIEVNDTFLAITGYSREELLGNKRFEDFLSIGGRIYYETHFAPLLKMQGEVNEINFDFIRKDKTRFPALVNVIQQSANGEQNSYNQFIVIDISQRKQYELELMNMKRKSEDLLLQISKANKELSLNIETIAEQKNQLEKLNATKDKFFSVVAHDLRSPLAALKGFSDILIHYFDDFNREEILSMGKQLCDSVDSTIKMADNLITWAMVQMKDFQFKEESIKVKAIISNVLDVYNKVASEKGINIKVSVNENLTILGDKNQIEFVIRNLVSNAIKFTPRNGYVSLEGQSLPDNLVQISISDSGVGISDEIKSKLFTINKIQSTNGTNGEKGTGLGLMLSYEFMLLNGGQIEIDSTPGKGSAFHLKLKADISQMNP